MEPGCTKRGAKIEKNALNHPKWLPDGSKDPFTQMALRFFGNVWVPPGAQKTQNIVFFLKKSSQGALFYRFLLRMPFFLIFSWILGRFCMKIQWTIL